VLLLQADEVQRGVASAEISPPPPAAGELAPPPEPFTLQNVSLFRCDGSLSGLTVFLCHLQFMKRQCASDSC
jgi:hypothetical protein